MPVPSYLPPDYLDNDRNTLAAALEGIIVEMGERDAAFASGFFNPSVWSHVADYMPLLENFRLLLGREPEVTYGKHGTLDLRQYYKWQLQEDVEELPFDEKHLALISSLVEFLRRDSVEVKLFQNPFLHAKAYIFPRVAIVGSSNFTPSGLTKNSELNLVRKEESVSRDLLDWYERFWKEADDYKGELIERLEASKFGGKPYSPFEVFIKLLYEYFRDRLPAETGEEFAGVALASFQEEGKNEAIRLLDAHNGAIVADSVGLGKTFIGMGIMEHYLLRGRRPNYIPKGLIVCPAQLRDLVWEPKLREYGIKADVRSQEEISREDFDWKQYANYDLVVVDESHNFRNSGIQRYTNLSRLITAGKPTKKVLLLTATPINNTIWDLYNQISLITRGSDSYFQEHGIANLRSFFRAVADDRADMFDLLELTTVRRSRYDMKKRQEAGETIVLPGYDEVHFPDRVLHSINYNLEETYKDCYEEISEDIGSLSLVSYNIESYKKDRDNNTVDRNNALIGIMKTLFFKRLESSVAAFITSVERQRDFQKKFLDVLEQGQLLDSSRYRKIMAIQKMLALEEDEESAEIEAILDELPVAEVEDFDLDAIRAEVAADIDRLNRMAERVNNLMSDKTGGVEDKKLAAVKEILANPLKGKKVLIFSHFKDTAKYLYDQLLADGEWLKQAESPCIEIIHGDTSLKERQRIVSHFAPAANAPEGQQGKNWLDAADEIDILISTDVLSEGQNLQDAGSCINYDLHWNPVRMIQRAGRIDRLGTLFYDLDIFNCFPDAGLEKLLGLVRRLQERILEIDRSVGLDASVLGETISGRSLDQLRRLREEDRNIVDELEKAEELISIDEMRLPLITFIQQVGEERIKEIPLGIHSGKDSQLPGTFFAFRAGDRHFWRFYPVDGGEVITSKRQIFKLLECVPEEERSVPEHKIFDLLEKATDEVLMEIKAAEGAARIPPQLKGLNLKLHTALNDASLFNEVPAELREKLNAVLSSASLVHFQRQPALIEMWQEFEEEDNIGALAEGLDTFFTENDLYQQVERPTPLEEIKREDLKLVCYELLGH